MAQIFLKTLQEQLVRVVSCQDMSLGPRARPTKQADSLRSSGLGIFKMFYVVATRKMVIVIQRAEETGKAARGHRGMAWRTPATLTPLAVPLDGGHNHLCHIVGKKMELDQAICFTDGNTET